ncbi:GerAB/ArcD/ProY family transporter [Anaeromicrobium sediminis]|uniref:Uncharacterized protein n=1 Tax=Anaeromicrobium sediminis TaxID=1478221 RepID=A0A267MNI0_9FIRM|nr:endospore germination permease [Anaeromicrobium sediminis]PAB60435.1 hypothetical protein CCE28_05940 [Anaeromicrobium sediminis]
MGKEVISDKQGICIVILFITGSSVLFGIGADAENDAWIAIIISILFSLPILMIYARILSLFQEKDIFDILELVFGKILGKIISMLYVWFALHLGGLVLRDFGEFPTIVSIPKTPRIVPMVCISFLCCWAIKEGIEVLGRSGEFMLPIVVSLTVVGVSLSIPNMEFKHIEPIFNKGINPIVNGAFAVFSFPFGETILFCGVFSRLKNNKSPYKIYLLGLIIGGILIFIISQATFVILGFDGYKAELFPTYAAATRIDVLDFIQRIEIIVAIGFFFGGFIKISVCLLVACKGIEKVFECDNYRYIAIITTLFMLNLSIIMHKSFLEVIRWTIATWRYYAFPFQVIIPISILIVAEIKKKREKIKVE